MKKITEQPSSHRHLEQLPIGELLERINQEDQLVPLAVSKAIPQVEPLVEKVVANLKEGGRLIYIGSGTSGRLGILDASECPPTFGVPDDMVMGLIAGGDQAIRKAVEAAEDSATQAWADLQALGVDRRDVVVGITASGTTPYVVEGLRQCQAAGIATGCITCNPGAPATAVATFPVVVMVGPEFVTGSTRMKGGTAQKLVLNMITTSTMIRLGRVLDDKMVDMQLSNEKLVDRGAKMLMQALELPYAEARILLLEHGSVRAALTHFRKA